MIKTGEQHLARGQFPQSVVITQEMLNRAIGKPVVRADAKRDSIANGNF